MEECREGGRGVTGCWYDFRGVTCSSFLIKTCQFIEWMGERKRGVVKFSLIAKAVSEKGDLRATDIFEHNSRHFIGLRFGIKHAAPGQS